MKPATRKKFEHSAGRQWAAYLTSTEILEVVDGGYPPAPSNAHLVGLARQDKAAGRASPKWFYIELRKGQKM